MQFAAQGFGQRDAGADHHHVDVGRGAPQIMVADIAPDHERPHALLVGQARNAAEYGIGERHAANGCF